MTVETGLYSALYESILRANGAPKAATSSAWMQWLDGAQRRGEFRGSERDWLGVDGWLSRREGHIPREDLQGFIKSNQLQMEVVMKGHVSPEDAVLPDGWTLRRDVDAVWRVRNAKGKIEGVGVDVLDTLRAANLGTTSPFSGETNYEKYTLPGGEQYRELLVRLPRPMAVTDVTVSESVMARHRAEWDALQAKREAAFGHPNYQTFLWQENRLLERLRLQTVVEMGGLRGHFGRSHFDEDNILVHLRFNQRTDVAGQRILFIEEIQSDWHQAGRTCGYRGPGDGHPFQVLSGEDGALLSGPFLSRAEADLAAIELRESGRSAFIDPPWHGFLGTPGECDGRVADAPFKATADWATLAFKQALRVAVQSGCDAVAWAPGQVQSTRYDMSGEVSGITWLKRPDGMFDVRADRVRGEPLYRNGLSLDRMTALLGKELASKIVEGVGGQDNNPSSNRGLLTQADIKLGGEGLVAFYDQILPSAIGHYAKRMGGAVSNAVIEVPNAVGEPGRLTVPAVAITPAMRECVKTGQPLFRRSPSAVIATGMTVDAVASIAREFLAAYRGGLSNLAVRIGQTLDDIYGPGATEALGATSAGAYHPARGILTVAADRMRDRACVEATLRHELLGHYGLNTFLPEDKRAILDTILASRSAPGMTKIWEAVDHRYADKDQDIRAEEVFALIAEQPRGPGARLWDSVLALVNKALRAAHMTSGETSRAELQVLAQSIACGLREGHRSQLNHPATDDALFRRSGTPAASVGFFMSRSAEDRFRYMRDERHEDSGAEPVIESPSP